LWEFVVCICFGVQQLWKTNFVEFCFVGHVKVLGFLTIAIHEGSI
jgi:hypothetical protein